MKRLLSEAAREAGTKVRSSWEDKNKRTLLWKRVGPLAPSGGTRSPR